MTVKGRGSVSLEERTDIKIYWKLQRQKLELMTNGSTISIGIKKVAVSSSKDLMMYSLTYIFVHIYMYGFMHLYM